MNDILEKMAKWLRFVSILWLLCAKSKLLKEEEKEMNGYKKKRVVFFSRFL